MSTRPAGEDRGEPDQHQDQDQQQRDPAAGPSVPVTDRPRMVLAGVCLLVPVVALMWVPSYARQSPELLGFPFFFWYQLAWVFACSGLTWTAYRLTLAARRKGRR